MEIVHSVRKLNTKKKTAVAVGYFDGMHLGHQELIHRMIEYAKKYNYSPAILTFDMHILRAEGKGKHDLFPREYTMHLAEKEGIDFYIDLPFEEIRNLKIKPKTKPIAKQMIFSIIGQPTSIKPTEPLEIPIQIAIATL